MTVEYRMIYSQSLGEANEDALNARVNEWAEKGFVVEESTIVYQYTTVAGTNMPHVLIRMVRVAG